MVTRRRWPSCCGSSTQLRDVTDRVLFRDYSAERFAFGRVATEIEAAATRAGLCLLGATDPLAVQVPDEG
jgi:hypothetical protein